MDFSIRLLNSVLNLPNGQVKFFGESNYRRTVLKLLCCACKKLYASKEVKENALASEGKSSRPETKTTVNRYVCYDLAV